MKIDPHSALYLGDVWHKRRRPKQHAFRYPIYYLMLDLDAFEAKTPALPRGLSLNRANLFSLYEKDFGARDGSRLKDHVLRLVQKPGGPVVTKVMMLTMPRLLGYGFNPISLYFCLDAEGQVASIVYEAHNTFGESHSYIFACAPQAGPVPDHQTEKRFHVSPFYPVQGDYRFSVRQQDDRLTLTIRYIGADQKPDMTACLKIDRKPLTGAALAGLFFRVPLVPFKVIAAIHFEALRLFLKRLRVYRKPVQAPVRTQFAQQSPTKR